MCKCVCVCVSVHYAYVYVLRGRGVRPCVSVHACVAACFGGGWRYVRSCVWGEGGRDSCLRKSIFACVGGGVRDGGGVVFLGVDGFHWSALLSQICKKLLCAHAHTHTHTRTHTHKHTQY